MTLRLPALALLLAGCTPGPPSSPPPPPPDASPPPGPSNDRIVNGVPAAPGSARWQVELRRATPYATPSPLPDWQRRHSCGGVLIAADWVLTAAHCIGPTTKADYVVRAGSLDLRGPMREYRIVRIMVHAGYDERGAPPLHDIALLRIAAIGPPIPVDEEPAPIALLGTGTAPPTLPATARVTVTGWGYTTEGVRADTPQAILAARRSSPSALLAAVLRLVPAAACMIPGTNRAIDPALHLCAGPNDPLRPSDSCQGDSGGPLTWQGPGGRWYLVGLVSWGPRQACGGGTPGVYTNIRAHLDWIEKAKLAPEARV